jgi:hypothetical protein
MIFPVPLTGASPQELTVPIPSPLRGALQCLFYALVATALYVDIQMAILIYDWYQILQWLGELSA